MTTDYGAASASAPQSSKTNILAIISLVAGIIALPLFCCWPISMPAALAAIVLGAIGMSQVKKTGEKGHALALAGVILGALAIVLFIALVVVGNVIDPNAFQKQFQPDGVDLPGQEDVIIPDNMDELGAPETDLPGEALDTEGTENEVVPEPADTVE